MAATSAPGDRPLNAMTVDVEDYFHVSVFDGLIPRNHWSELPSRVTANTERLLEIFDESGVRATFFVLGWVADRFPKLLRRIAASGHELASHGYAHRIVYDQTPEGFREDIRRSKRVIEDAAGVAVHGYRAPSYSVTPRSLWALDILVQEGYRYDTSIFPIRHDRYGIPLSPRYPYRIPTESGGLIEAPASTVRVAGFNLPVAGGGYFRILPYWWTHWGIARINTRERRSAIFYIHPWEIDPDQPRLEAGLLSRFRHYFNLAQTQVRLGQLLRDFQFGTVEEVLSLDGQSVAVDGPVMALPYLL